MKQIGFYDEEDRLEKLSKLGDSLEKLNRIIDWEMFRPEIAEVFHKEAKGAGGRPPFDHIMMFKILVLQRVYNLSDDQTEYQINDRISFMRFLGLSISDRIPDAKTIWLFRDTLVKANVIKKLFDKFTNKLDEEHIITRTGSILDATFIEAPIQRNHGDEEKQVRKGEVPEEWKKPENKNKLRQKDVDAKHTRKGNKSYYGYKNHIKADADSKLITNYSTSEASMHDSQKAGTLIDDKDQAIYGDSAYIGPYVQSCIPEGCENRIHKRGTKYKAISEEEKLNNHIKSKTRCRIEHIFGFMTQVFRGLTVRSIGIRRADFNIGLTNLTYNLFRYEFLRRESSRSFLGTP